MVQVLQISRKGSQIACNSVLLLILKTFDLDSSKEFEDKIQNEIAFHKMIQYLKNRSSSKQNLYKATVYVHNFIKAAVFGAKKN